MSATPDSTLANPEQLIADLQRQLAEREAELAEAREQQAATAEVLQVINSSPGDLAPVFDVILKKAHALCGSNHGALFLCDGERFLPAAMSDPELLATPLRQGGMGSDAPLVQPLLAGEPFAHIIDLTLVDHPLARAAVAKGVRTLLSIPLRKDGTLVGMINAARFEVHPFSEKQIALLQNFATQAVIAIENARLLTETREALEQQTATGEVLQVINSSPGDLAPVFDAMLEKATRLCEAPFGILRTWDGERFHFGAVHGEPEFSDWVRRRHPIQPDRDNSPLGRILQGEQIVHVADVSSDESSRTSTGFREMIMESGLRSSIMVALRKEDALVGTITVYRQEVRPFSDKQIALLENFAAQAVIAMENARLITETREALEQQTATAEVLGVINSSPGDLQPVFETMLERAIRLCEADEGLLTNRDREEYEITANRSRRPQMVSLSKGKRFQANRDTVIGRVALEGRTIHLADVNADPDYRNPEMAREALPGTLLGVPLLREGLVVGTFSLARERIEAFTDKQIALVENFAAQAVIAMENARLLTETREALEQQTATAEVLQVINSSPGDLSPVFDAMIRKAVPLCGAAQGSLRIFDGEALHLAAWHGDPRFVDRARELGPIVPRPGHPMEPLLRGERVIHLADAKEAAAESRDLAVQERVAVANIRSWLAVALRKDGALLGTIAVSRHEVRPFSEKEITLLENFAAQAVIAMENARLITETREALEQQTATAEVLQVINSSPGNLTPVFDAILEKAHTLCGAAHGNLWTYDGELFHPVATRGNPRFAEWLRDRSSVPPAPGTVLERIVRGEDFLQIADAASDQAFCTSAYSREVIEVTGARTTLIISLRKDTALRGVIFAYRREVCPFSEKQIALFKSFAAQAVIAMENARLLTETREALEQQTATAEVLQVINRSPGNLQPVFDAILEKAHNLCGAAHGGLLMIRDGEAFRIAAAHGEPSLIEAWRRTHPARPPEGTPLARIVGGERIVHLADALADQSYHTAPAQIQRVLKAGAIRTLLMVPLRKDDALLGVISAFRQEVRPFSEKQIALLQNFAGQAIIAMENARLLTETREALEQQTATAEVLGVINSSPDELKPVFDAILDKAHSLCGVEYGVLLTYDGELFWPVAMHGAPPSLERRNGFRPSSGFQGLLRGERLLHIHDMAEVAAQRPDEPVYRDLFESGGIRTQLAVPLRKDGRLLGIITANRREVRPFSDKQIALLENFAAQAVVAMENARLLGELRQRTEEVAELNRGLEARVAEQVDELGRVGRLKRFLAPQLAELIVSQGDEKILESHRREIVVVFCDLRGYTAFTETAEPEEVLDFLREYHGALGPLVSQYEGTLDQFSGDGMMVLFNDPVPCPDPRRRRRNGRAC